MELMTIYAVSREFNVSTRTLRYYEQIGLLQSAKKEDYAYRAYDDAAVKRLRQILLLRKLRISLKDIGVLLKNNDAAAAVEVFSKSLNEISSEIAALSVIRSILQTLIERLMDTAGVRFDPDILKEESMVKIVGSLVSSKFNFKEDRSMEMEELNKANENLSRLKNPRIFYLPPFAVAASRYIGENPE
jgi:DNA-binding transcriptional MerR regulator